MIDDVLIQQLNNLQKQVDGLIKPETQLGIALISETALTGAATSVTFSNISSRFRHLILLAQIRTDRVAETDSVGLQFNADGAANYDSIQLYGSGASASALTSRAATSSVLGICEGASARASNFSPLLSIIMNYSRNDAESRILSLSSGVGNLSADTDMYAILGAGNWRSVAVVTSLTLLPTGGGVNFVSGSRFQLYGWY